MKCLSVRQPWAHVIVSGAKDVENRSWATAYRGPLLIHAGLAMHAAGLDDLCRWHGIKLERRELQFGAILGVVDLVDCRETVTSPWHHEGYFGWYLANPRRLPAPIPYKGKLRLFDVPDRLLPESWRP